MTDKPKDLPMGALAFEPPFAHNLRLLLNTISYRELLQSGMNSAEADAIIDFARAIRGTGQWIYVKSK